MKIGIYVGSFNPVHKGHIKIVNYLLKEMLDKVIIMPTGSYWDKNDLLDMNHRIEMLKFYENDRIAIQSEKNDLPYTYLIMEYFSDKYIKEDLYLIIGADNIVNFDKWKNYKQLLKCNLIIINRDGIDIKYHLNRLGKNDKYFITEKLNNIDISSTQIRESFSSNMNQGMDEFIDTEVYKYIISKGLEKNFK